MSSMAFEALKTRLYSGLTRAHAEKVVVGFVLLALAEVIRNTRRIFLNVLPLDPGFFEVPSGALFGAIVYGLGVVLAAILYAIGVCNLVVGITRLLLDEWRSDKPAAVQASPDDA